MLYSFENGKVLTQGLEYSVSYHCNLRCYSCSHLSPYSQKRFPLLDTFRADLKKLNEGLHTSDIRLLGGEPLLNPEISDFIKVAKTSGIADIVSVTTNGLLLHRMDDEFWKNVDLVRITIYPGHKPKEKFIQMFEDRALESGTRLIINDKAIFRTTIVTAPHPRDWITDMIFNTCGLAHLGHCHMIHEGRLYKCAKPPFLPEYLEKIGQNIYNPENDAFNIHQSDKIYYDLKKFFLCNRTLDACRFCLGNVGKRVRHHQLELELIKHPNLKNIQRTSHLDTKLFVAHCSYYYFRRFLENLTGQQFW